MMIDLRLPREDEEQEFLRARRATTPEMANFLHYYQEGMTFVRYLEVLAEQARGENLPPNHVPTTFLFAFAAARIVGRVSIRHELNEFLLRAGGHIGYFVVPEFRRRGIATAILQQSLQIAHNELGISRVLVTCDDDNIGSIRTIEKNGGVLENVVTGPDLAKPKRRYWIQPRTGYWPGGPIVLASHDPRWSLDFEQESAAVTAALGDLLVAIHHIGSTAIPGIVAKPVIDLLAVVTEVEALDLRAHLLEDLGYEAMGEFGIAGRRYFRKKSQRGARTHQIHAFARESAEIARHLAFRDYLREHPDEAQKYERLKLELARKFASDIEGYTNGKTEFIRGIEGRARSGND